MVGAVAFAAAATVLSSTFDWPDILREPAGCGAARRSSPAAPGLVWTWFATAWTYAILAVPILLLPAVLGRRDDPVLRAATAVGATSVLLSLIGFLRWVFVVPPLARSYVTGDPVTQAAVDAAWTAQHQFGGALLGEHLGQLLVIGWSVTLSVIILRTRVLPRWLGVTGLVVSALYLLNQGDVLATAVPGFPVWDLAGLLGSTGWGLWVAALGVTVLLRPIVGATPRTGATPRSFRANEINEINETDGVDGVGAIDTAVREHAHHHAADRGRAEERNTVTRSGAPRPSFLRSWLIWTAGFLAFPIAGLAGTAVAGRVDTPVAALLGGAVTGLVIGAGQAVASSRRLDPRRWIPATAIGMGLGLLLGAATVDYRTSLGRPRPDGRAHRARPRCRAGDRPAPPHPPALDLGRRAARCCGPWAGPLPPWAGSPSTSSSPSSAPTAQSRSPPCPGCCSTDSCHNQANANPDPAPAASAATASPPPGTLR